MQKSIDKPNIRQVKRFGKTMYEVSYKLNGRLLQVIKASMCEAYNCMLEKIQLHITYLNSFTNRCYPYSKVLGMDRVRVVRDGIIFVADAEVLVAYGNSHRWEHRASCGISHADALKALS